MPARVASHYASHLLSEVVSMESVDPGGIALTFLAYLVFVGCCCFYNQEPVENLQIHIIYIHTLMRGLTLNYPLKFSHLLFNAEL